MPRYLKESLLAIIEKRGQIISVIIQTHHFCILTVRDFFRVHALFLFSMVCMWLGSLDMRERMWVTRKFGVPVSAPFALSATLSMSFK